MNKIDDAGQAVGQVERWMRVTIDGIIYECRPIDEVAVEHGYSPSYIRRLCDSGKLIAIKYKRRWWVEKNLSEDNR